MLRRLTIVTLAGLAAAAALGLAAGLLARLLMRLLVVVAGETGHFSLVGTMFIVLLFIVSMVPGAVATAHRSRWVARVLLALGAGLLLFQSVVIPLQEDRAVLGDAGPVAVALTLLVLAAFPAVMVAQALLTARVARTWAHRWAGSTPVAPAPVLSAGQPV